MLRPLQRLFAHSTDPRILVGIDDGDDAAVYAITDDTAIIQTIDFFTPVVDDPYDYGAIAAANAMNDVYAMGGQVVLAMNVCAFPSDLPDTVVGEILRGGAEKVREAGGSVVGGHTVDDPEPKYGLSVTGIVHPDRLRTKSKAVPGDHLILTKPIGTGAVTTALKNDSVDEGDLAAAVASMKLLHADIAEIVAGPGVHSCTDVSGFSLIGHANEIASHSGVGLELDSSKVELLPGLERYVRGGFLPGGTARNRDFFSHRVDTETSIPEWIISAFYTPETSGGLLIAVEPDHADRIVRQCADLIPATRSIGRVVEGAGIRLS